MAKYLEKEKAGGLIEELTFERPEPPTWKYGRYAALQMAEINRDLWSDVRESESGNYIISGLNKKVSRLDFEAFSLAIAQTLYNQSVMSGNGELNSGLKKLVSDNVSKLLGYIAYMGEIVVTRDDLCRKAWGKEPTTETKKKMDALLETFTNTPVNIKYPNGDTRESRLCVIMEKYNRKKDNAVIYALHLNPIFSICIKNQFGELPQDITAQLDKSCKKMGAEHIILLRWLSVQDKRVPHPRNIETLITDLKMEDYFDGNRGKAEKRLISVCNTMVDIGILSKYETERKLIRNKERIVNITFYLNPQFPRHNKGIEAALDGAENDKGIHLFQAFLDFRPGLLRHDLLGDGPPLHDPGQLRPPNALPPCLKAALRPGRDHRAGRFIRELPELDHALR